jgi:hypothetical protein
MKIISYCLWGTNPKYTIGAIKNAQLASEYYPDWVCRFYVSKTVPENIILQLKTFKNVQVVECQESGDWKFTMKRFLPMSEDIELMISRDTDSRIEKREVSAVNEWIKSGKSAHIMRDHPYHGGFPMLAGMFGIKGGIIKNVSSLFNLVKQLPEQYHYDQIFLSNFIYPFIENNVLIHDEIFTKNAFPIKRTGLRFVGQAFDENDKPCNPEHAELLRNI